MILRVPHPSRFLRRVGSYAPTPLTLFSRSWVPLPLRTLRLCVIFPFVPSFSVCTIHDALAIHPRIKNHTTPPPGLDTHHASPIWSAAARRRFYNRNFSNHLILFRSPLSSHFNSSTLSL